MRPGARLLALLLASFLAACGAFTPPKQQPGTGQLPFVLVSPAAHASPTPTAFLPPAADHATPTSLYYAPVATLQPFLPTATASPTAEPPVDPSPTPNIAMLFPTMAAPPPAETAVAPAPLPSLTDADTINFLLIGSDKRPGGSFRTDTMVVVILWPKESQVSMISIPRDLWIYIPTVGMQRVNTAYQNGEMAGYPGGGPGLLRDTIAYNLGIRIDHMAMVEFDGFRRIVDTLGGVDVPVACPYTDWRLIDPSYDPYNEASWTLYTVPSGMEHMDGDLALWYARSRMKSNDFDRGRRQQEVLRAILARALSTDALARIPELYTAFSGTITTDLGLADLVRLALYAPRLPSASIRSYYIRPPYVSDWITPGGAQVLLPNHAALEQLLAQATSLSSITAARQSLTVEIQNGTGNAGWDSLAASRLSYAGFNTRSGTADRQDYTSSVLTDFTVGQDAGVRNALLSGLGLYSAAVLASPDPNSSVQYRLVVGYDYRPCFQPQDLAH